MNSRIRKAVFTAGIMAVMLAVATTSYASTAAVLYNFSDSGQINPFNVGIDDGTFRPYCIVGADKSWSSDGSLEISVNESGDCSGYSLVVDSQVTLSSAINNPSTQIVIKDSSNGLDLSHIASSLTTIADSSKVTLALIIVDGGNGWSIMHGNWGAGSNSGTGDLQYYLPLRSGPGAGDVSFNVYISSLEIDSN